MKDADFKNKLKNNLAGYSTPMDLEAEWAALDARRPNNRKRPIFWLWLTGLGVAILFSTILLWPDGDQQNSPDILINISAQDLENVPNIVASKIQEQLIDQDNLNNQANKENTKATNTNESKITKTKKPKIAAEFNETVTYQKTITPRLTEPTVNFNLENLNQKEKEAATDALTLPSSESMQLENPTRILEQKNASQKASPKESVLTLLSLKPALFPLRKNDEKLELPQNFFPKIKEKSNPWSIGISAGYGKTFRNLYSNNNDLSPYLDRRKAGETLLDRWDINLNVRRTIHKNWFAEVGIGYALATDRFEDTDVTITNDVFEDQVKSITFLSNGNIQENLGDVIGEVTTTIVGTYFQYNKNATAHLMLGRNILFSKKWGANISGGASYSFLTRKTGTVFSNDTLLQSYSNLKDGNYRKSGLINGIAQVEFCYQLNRGLQFSFGIKGEKNLHNAYLDKNEISEKRGVIGLQLGLRKGI